MQKAIYILSFLCCIIGMQQLASAQCAYDNTQFGTYLAPTTVGTDVVLSTCFYGGEYAYVTGLVAGNTYRFSTCGDTDFDTQITVYESGPGAVLGYNDDGCGAQSTIDFVYAGGTGNVDVLIDQYPCTSNTLCMTLNAQLVALGTPPPPAGGCGASGSYCYGDSNTGTDFASTTPPAGQAVSITLGGSIEACCDAIYVRQNGVNIAGPFAGTLTGTYTGAVGTTISLYLTSDGSVSCGSGFAPTFSIACTTPVTPPPAGGCGVSGSYCYGDSNTGTTFASTTPSGSQVASITLSGSVESCCDAVYVRQNGVDIAGPFAGTLSGTYTGTVGATMSLYLTSDGSVSCASGYGVGFSIACTTPPPSFSVTLSNIVNAVCNTGGSVRANAVGGTSPYSVLWSNGATTATISNLAAGTYTVTVTSGNGATATASTTLTNLAIAVPTGLTTTNITGTTATLSWGAVAGAANYSIQGRKVGAATWTNVGPVTGTSKNIQSQIACGKTYEWKVRANCAGGLTFSAFSPTVTFTTSPCPSKTDSELVAEWDGGFKTFSLSPNPANSVATLYYSTETETPLSISIIDVTGRVVAQQNTLATQGDNTINLATNQLPQGYYVVELNDGTTKMHEKLLIAR
jgi:hypothetical protein